VAVAVLLSLALALEAWPGNWSTSRTQSN